MENLKELPFLTDLVFLGNPVEEESAEDGTYVSKVILWLVSLGLRALWLVQVISVLLSLTKLDGNPVIRDTGEKEEEEEDADSDSSELDEELYNDPATQEIIKTLVL